MHVYNSVIRINNVRGRKKNKKWWESYVMHSMIAGEVEIFCHWHWRPWPANCCSVIWDPHIQERLKFKTQKKEKNGAENYDFDLGNFLPGEHANEAGQADLRRFHGAHHHHPTEYQKPTQVPAHFNISNSNLRKLTKKLINATEDIEIEIDIWLYTHTSRCWESHCARRKRWGKSPWETIHIDNDCVWTRCPWDTEATPQTSSISSHTPSFHRNPSISHFSPPLPSESPSPFSVSAWFPRKLKRNRIKRRRDRGFEIPCEINRAPERCIRRMNHRCLLSPISSIFRICFILFSGCSWTLKAPTYTEKKPSSNFKMSKLSWLSSPSWIIMPTWRLWPVLAIMWRFTIGCVSFLSVGWGAADYFYPPCQFQTNNKVTVGRWEMHKLWCLKQQ